MILTMTGSSIKLKSVASSYLPTITEFFGSITMQRLTMSQFFHPVVVFLMVLLTVFLQKLHLRVAYLTDVPAAFVNVATILLS